jgi:subtilisin-like proprotein convertase family protein
MRPWLLLPAALLVASTRPADAVTAKDPVTSLEAREFFHPELVLATRIEPLDHHLAGLRQRAAWTSFFEKYGGVPVFLDARSGSAASIILSVPLLPGIDGGKAEPVRAGSSARPGASVIDGEKVARLVRSFVESNQEAIGIDASQIGHAPGEQVTDHLWQVSLPQVVNGVPVRHGRLVATINHGNLVLLGTESWGDVRIGTKPRVTAGEALAAGFALIGGRTPQDEIFREPRVEIVPMATGARAPGETYMGRVGSGYGHRLVWSFGFRREGEHPSWEMLVDARSGEVLALVDTNQYATGRITGGVYTMTNTGTCPSRERCGTMIANTPMPFADTGVAAPNDFASAAGLFQWTSGTARTTLSGRYADVTDVCGSVNEISATGNVDLGGANHDHDCTTSGLSGGDTPASRTAYYEVNRAAEIARGWLPSNAWLLTPLATNVNIISTCSAFWNGTSINFFRSGGGCRNPGEIAGVIDHEWGHGLDQNDANHSYSNTTEAYADMAAIFRLQASCVGYGFHQGDFGCGQTSDGTGGNRNESHTGSHCTLDCSGLREADWDRHEDHTPDTPINFVCEHCVGGPGPCGGQVHCSAAPPRQAAWDLAARDLRAPPFGLPEDDAFIVASRLFHIGSGNVGDWYACDCAAAASNGCGAGSGYLQWLAADDDNGNLSDGTPHMTALHAAFDRHGIACSTPTPQNAGCAGAPAQAPLLTITRLSGGLSLSWTSVAGAATYRVFRAEGGDGCAIGKARIAQTAGTTYFDADVAPWRGYSYLIQPVGTNASCAGPVSACVTESPCADALSVARRHVGCSDIVEITLQDPDVAGSGAQLVSVASATEPAAESVPLAESPPGSGSFAGTILTTTEPGSGGDSMLTVWHGDTITVDYLDASACGATSLRLIALAEVDCAPPVLTNVWVENLTGTRADLRWTTDEPSDSLATYGPSVPPQQSAPFDPTLVASHRAAASGLAECSIHYFDVTSTDEAGNQMYDDNAGDFYSFETVDEFSSSPGSPDPPVSIPDFTGSPGVGEATIMVPEGDAVLDVNATVSITHTRDGDLRLTLLGPDGTSVLLADRRGGDDDHFTGTSFDDEAASPISSGSPPFAGSFRPEASLGALDGRTAIGLWTLRVEDLASSEVGTIDQFTLELTATRPCPPSAPGEVARVLWDGPGKETLSWIPIPGAHRYRVFRGLDQDLPALTDATVDSCQRDVVLFPSTGGVLFEVPDPSRFYWYLVMAENASGLGPPGHGRVLDSSGPCP